MRIDAIITTIFGSVAIVGLISVAACAPAAPPVPTTPHDIIAAFLTKNGMHVVDVSMMVSTGDNAIEPSSQNSSSYVYQPITICQSAPYGAMFRAYGSGGTQVIGVACLEKDNSISIPLQK